MRKNNPATLVKQLLDDDIAKALKKHHGLIRNTAKELNCSHSLIYKRINNSEELKKVWEEARRGLIDMAESALIRKIEEGDTKAIIFTLQTLGKERGYELKNGFTLDMGTKIILEAKEAAKRIKTASQDNTKELVAELIDDTTN